MALLTGLFLVLLPFQIWSGLFLATQTAKVLFLGWGVVVFVTIGGAYYSFTGKSRKITFTATDLALVLLLIYIVVHIGLIRPVQLHPLFVLQWCALGTLFIVLRRIDANYQLLLLIFLMIAGAAQAIYGNLQLYGIYPSYHNLFKLTGSFFNPGPYSGYLVSVLPVAVGLYFIKSLKVREINCLNVRLFDCLNVKKFKSLSFVLLERLKREASNISNISNPQTAKPSNSEASIHSILITFLRLIAITTIITIVLVLPAARSRAAWLAAACSILYLFGSKGHISELWHKFVLTGRRKWLLYLVIAVTVLSVATGLYIMKKGSADGRVLIWKVTLNSIKEQPLWGHGIEKFKAFYMDGQAGYFKYHPDSPKTAVAADNIYAFNEPLRISYETGLIGLALVLLVIWSAFRNDLISHQNQDSENLTLLTRTGLLSLLIFGLFSYPAEIVPIMVNVILFLTIIAAGQKPLFTLTTGTKLRNPFVRMISASALIVTAIWASQQLYRIDKAYTQWDQAYTTYSIGAYEDAAEEYEKIYPTLKNNGAYLINYGKALSMAGKHEKAIEILERSKPFLTNTILYTALGDSYKATGQTSKAETSYLHAWHMVPARFYPKYLLAKLYDETRQHEKAVAIAKELLRKEVKIESTAVNQILEEMRKIIEKREAELLNKSNIHINNNLDSKPKGTKEGVYRSVVSTSGFKLQKW